MSAQYQVLDVDGNVIVIVLERSADADFEAFAADAGEVMDSVTLSGVPTVSDASPTAGATSSAAATDSTS